MTKTNKQDNEKLVSILSYLVVGIIWYFVDESVKKSRKTKFHVKQALNILIIWFVLDIIFGTLWFFYPIWALISIGLLILWIIGLINAINMKQSKIPIIGDIAENYLKF